MAQSEGTGGELQQRTEERLRDGKDAVRADRGQRGVLQDRGSIDSNFHCCGMKLRNTLPNGPYVFLSNVISVRILVTSF